ncbi:MAG: hybrid sensor histidine kinase/response regulator [Deltaproteobacteria bacterium]|nr:MAG: hybrid sensor histidine kinase/response regulator [Deltaproteobacteria bacterium]
MESKIRILIVEDEGLIALSTRKKLENLGYDVIDIVASGEEAIAEASETQPDLILMDIMLSGEIDGVTAAASILKKQSLPIIYLTAYSDKDTLLRAKETGPFGYLLKPFGEKELETTIEIALYKHRMEQELRQARDELEERVQERTAELARSNEALKQFAYVVSHDLREPLRKITSYIGLFQQRYEDDLDEKADKYIHYIVDGAERMQQLIVALLTYSRIGRQELSYQLTDLNQIVQQVLHDLDLCIQENQAVVTCDPLPQLQVDPQQISQLFQNLINNALKFHGTQAPEIHITATQEDSEWKISVQDNGIGIKKEYTERIFKVFQRLHTQKEYKGTGIGLSICQQVVERHNGRMWVESTPGAGSTFYFTLPDKQVHHHDQSSSH